MLVCLPYQHSYINSAKLMLSKILTILVIPLVSSCLFCKSIKKRPAFIEGYNVPKEIVKIYIAVAPRWDIILDSVDCSNGQFKLIIDKNGKFEPFAAILSYRRDDGSKGKFYVRNEVSLKTNGRSNLTDVFMLDFGINKIENFILSKSGCNISVENEYEELLRQNYFQLDCSLPKEKGELRNQKFAEIKRIIKANPNSYYLLSVLTASRLTYSKGELKEVFALFDDRVRVSESANKLRNHIINSLDTNENTKSLMLTSSRNVKKDNINRTSKLNMLIFWASWCGPCRKEIPYLKEIRNSIADDDFYMANISIDTEPEKWKHALLEEDMSWDQFITTGADLQRVKSEYAFDAIPFVVFTDKNGKVLRTYRGFDASNTVKYKEFIESMLKQ